MQADDYKVIAEYEGQLAAELANRPNCGPNGWQRRTSKELRASYVAQHATIAAHYAALYLSAVQPC